MARSQRQRGFTFLEVSFGLVIIAILVSLLGQTLSTSNGLTTRTRADLRAAEEARRNLISIADVLRGVSESSLAGFNAQGVATQPIVRAVTGAYAGAPTLGTTQELRWQATQGQVDGVNYPGEVIALQDGTSRTLASRVPQGGFRVTQQGRTLLVDLTTYYSTSERVVKTRTDQISVTLRN